MNLIPRCEICKKSKLWFLIKQRSMKPVLQMPVVKSEKKMCGKCFGKAKKYFIQQGVHNVEEK